MARTSDTRVCLQTLEGKNASGSLQGVVYGYDTAGRLQSRYWVRTAAGVTNRVGTTYGYDAAGDLATVAYLNDPSSTLGIKHIRDRLGRLQQAERHTYGVTGPNMTDTDGNEAFFSSLAGLGEPSDAPNPPMNRWAFLGLPWGDSGLGSGHRVSRPSPGRRERQ